MANIAQAAGLTAQEATALRNISTLLPAISSTGAAGPLVVCSPSAHQDRVATWQQLITMA